LRLIGIISYLRSLEEVVKIRRIMLSCTRLRRWGRWRGLDRRLIVSRSPIRYVILTRGVEYRLGVLTVEVVVG